jgi:superfamily II DNA/RNA helicase
MCLEQRLGPSLIGGERGQVAPTALIICPTRELACQIFDEARKVNRSLHILIEISFRIELEFARVSLTAVNLAVHSWPTCNAVVIC